MFEPNDDDKKDEEEEDDELEDDELEDDEDTEDDASATDDKKEEEEDDEEGDDDETDGDEGEDDEEGDDVKDFQESDLEDPEKRKKFLKAFNESKSALAQRAIWRKRAKKLGWGKEQEQNPPAKKPVKGTKSGTSEVEEARHLNELTNFRLDHPELPRLMVKEVETFAKAAGISMEKAMKRPLVRRFVNDKKLRERLSKASPSSRHRSPQSKPQVDWSKATPEQVAAHAAEVRNRRAAGNK